MQDYNFKIFINADKNYNVEYRTYFSIIVIHRQFALNRRRTSKTSDKLIFRFETKHVVLYDERLFSVFLACRRMFERICRWKRLERRGGRGWWWRGRWGCRGRTWRTTRRPGAWIELFYRSETRGNCTLEQQWRQDRRVEENRQQQSFEIMILKYLYKHFDLYTTKICSAVKSVMYQ